MKLLSKHIPLIKKIISFTFWGILTTALNVILYYLFRYIKLSVQISTVLAWFLCVLFAFITNKKYVFKGVIDRVDVSKDNEIIVIDYKTGRIEPSLKSVYVGEKIQLYLYLKYFLDKGYKPVGVFYLPITSGYKKGGASFAMQGQMLDDLIAFGKIDNNFFAHQNESFKSLNVKFDTTCTKGGVKFGRTGAQNRIQESDFYRIAEYVTALCAQAIEDISSGDLEKNPIQGGCKYCMYKRICGDVTPRADVNASIESFYFETEENGERRERTEGVTK